MHRAATTFFRQFLLLHEAQRELGVSRMTLWRWERQGKLTTYRIGREVLIEKAEVERVKRERRECKT